MLERDCLRLTLGGIIKTIFSLPPPDLDKKFMYPLLQFHEPVEHVTWKRVRCAGIHIPSTCLM
jgi:hypothetical protein